MVKFDRFTLENGLKVLIQTDESTPFVVVNVTYNVGAKDEDPKQTGFAHLFEHLMFGGSDNAPKFDQPLELAGASNNAFTSNDVTNYYEVIPRDNIETALWLESDRMAFLTINEQSLSVQRKVVVEEFKERYLNKPYGMAWHHLRELVYKKHPYQWPTIGKTVKEIEDAKLDDVRAFYQKFYHPNNAILTLCGNVSIADKPLVEKWFGSLPAGKTYNRSLPQEEKQTKARRKEVEADVPVDSLYLAFAMPGRGQNGYYACDLLSDLLSNGKSARLYQNLVKKNEYFSDINAYITGSFETGMFVITGKPTNGISQHQAEEVIWEQLNELINNPPSDAELQKVQNKVEANLTYQLLEPFYMALSLAFFELMGDAEDVNREMKQYQKVTKEEIINQAKNLFTKEQSNTLWFTAKNNAS